MLRRESLLLAVCLALPPVFASAQPGASCLLPPRQPQGSCTDPDGVLAAGLKALKTSRSGRALAALLKDGGTQVSLRQGAYAYYSDADDRIYFDPEWFAAVEPWQTAVILAHELEHARQNKLGLNASVDRGQRELGAFLVQCRVWVELGARLRPADWSENRWNAQDMWAWLERPWSAVAALSLRGGFAPFAGSGTPAQRYFEQVLAEEAAWRLKWAWAYPSGRDSQSAALFILRQAARAALPGSGGPVAPGLPEAFEALALGGPGKAVLLEGKPSLEDAALLSALPFSTGAAESGGYWRAVRN